MHPNTSKSADRISADLQRAEDLAAQLGVSASAVWTWKRTGTLPKNPLIRAAYLRKVGAKQPKAAKK